MRLDPGSDWTFPGDHRGAESESILARFERLHPKLIDLSLDRIRRLLDRLGNPERQLPPVVHVAGTNGKGSVIAFLEAMLVAAGLRVHVYTSPHLVRFHERMRIAGEPIAETRLCAVLEECERTNDGAPITFFEITTAAAFLAFARIPADAILLETGLGGRLDATNMVDRPALAALTPVSLDHVHHLGTTRGAIAREKAGILKPRVAAVIGPQRPAADRIIVRRAREIESSLHRHGRDWHAGPRPGGMRYEGSSLTLDLPPPALFGAHQIDNAGTAIACLEKLALPQVHARAIARGLATARWPARLQRLFRGPLPRLLPKSQPWELWLDGGHNPGASLALARTLAGWRDRPLYLVVGMLETKDTRGFLRPLAPLATALWGVPVPNSAASQSAEDIASAASRLGLRAQSAADVAAALGQILASMPGPGRVLICGSLYLAGHVLAANG
ncbi:MAG: bifunctional folylpolyglutamate synthase/dihydrofolate synthase [Alphaproteobacteria bacterium]